VPERRRRGAGFDLSAVAGLQRHCVPRDAYDAAVFAELLEHSRDLSLCSRRGQARLRSFPALLGDIFCLLFKLRPRLIERSFVRPAFQVNRYLLARLAAEPRMNEVRAVTTLREEAAAAAAVSVAERLLRELAANDLEEENLLFELEETLEEGSSPRKTPVPVRRRSAQGHRAPDVGAGEGPTTALPTYDVQQRLEMAEAIEGLHGFVGVLAMAEALASRMAREDPSGFQPTQLYDIGLGSELSRLLPGELVSLKAWPRRKDFLRRLLESRLLTYEMTGSERNEPMVVAVDVSHSMFGEKDVASKGLAIALCRRAAERGQVATALLFGHRGADPWRLDFEGCRPHRRQIVALAETFFGGGTDFERPISSALELLSRKNDGGGVIVLITDGQCRVGERWLSELLMRKARHRVRILSVIVDAGACSEKTAASFSDRVVRFSELAGLAPSAQPRPSGKLEFRDVIG
jgi:uncharacterized protein with von Willebrand factor type A (vWA) domain